MRIAPVGIAVALNPASRTRCPDPAAARLVDSGRPGGRGQPCHAQYQHRAGRRRRRGRRGERGVSGAGIAGATALGIDAPRIAADRGRWVAGADVAARSNGPPAWSRAGTQAQAAELIYTLVGTSLATQESVPAAFAVLAAVPGDPWRACLLAASLGGDCDTIAAMAGAIAGACHSVTAFPPEAIAVIDAQGLGLASLADDLYALRLRSRPVVR